MQVTLHLTNQCNMRCGYCYVDHNKPEQMSPTVVRQAIDFVLNASKHQPGLTFFGGEPLLCEDIIYEAVEYGNYKSKQAGASLVYNLTTNGLLLDDDFLEYANRNKILIALSIDGIQEAHDAFRIDTTGQGTHARTVLAARNLLDRQSYAPAMMLVNPQTVRFFTDSVDFVFGLGFRYLLCAINYSSNWDKQALRELQNQYRKLAQWYYTHTVAEDKFYFSPFDVKIESHIKGENWCQDRCELGQRHLSIAPSGVIYPCIQFTYDDAYAIGSVQTGLDEAKRLSLYQLNREDKRGCAACSIRARCLHTCGCINRQVTGRIDRVAPSLCAHERILLPIADKLAEKLYQERRAMFIQKHYNAMYPFLSAIEDSLTPS